MWNWAALAFGAAAEFAPLVRNDLYPSEDEQNQKDQSQDGVFNGVEYFFHAPTFRLPEARRNCAKPKKRCREFTIKI
jgi:hypothetical protein